MKTLKIIKNTTLKLGMTMLWFKFPWNVPTTSPVYMNLGLGTVGPVVIIHTRINGLRYSWVSKKTANLHQSNEKVHSSFIATGKTIDDAERERALTLHNHN